MNEGSTSFLIFVFGVLALVCAFGVGKTINNKKYAGGPPILAVISLVCVLICALLIDKYYSPSFPENLNGLVVATYTSVAETPKDQENITRVFIVQAKNGKEYKITSDNLFDKKLVLEFGDVIIKLDGKIQKYSGISISP